MGGLALRRGSAPPVCVVQVARGKKSPSQALLHRPPPLRVSARARPPYRCPASFSSTCSPCPPLGRRRGGDARTLQISSLSFGSAWLALGRTASPAASLASGRARRWRAHAGVRVKDGEGRRRGNGGGTMRDLGRIAHNMEGGTNLPHKAFVLPRG